jgi:hypothetical protein
MACGSCATWTFSAVSLRCHHDQSQTPGISSAVTDSPSRGIEGAPATHPRSVRTARPARQGHPQAIHASHLVVSAASRTGAVRWSTSAGSSFAVMCTWLVRWSAKWAAPSTKWPRARGRRRRSWPRFRFVDHPARRPIELPTGSGNGGGRSGCEISRRRDTKSIVYLRPNVLALQAAQAYSVPTVLLVGEASSWNQADRPAKRRTSAHASRELQDRSVLN